VSGRKRRVVRKPACEEVFRKILTTDRRAAEAIAGFEMAVSRIPEHGMAVRGAPDVYSRPFHTDRGSYLVLYSFDDSTVTCIAVREVPSSTF
jgi:hypothetical protein